MTFGMTDSTMYYYTKVMRGKSGSRGTILVIEPVTLVNTY